MKGNVHGVEWMTRELEVSLALHARAEAMLHDFLC
jgi:hypothetical protein